jgi:hypothetical protein
VLKPAAKEKGLLDKLKFWDDDEDGKKDVPKEQVKPVEPIKPETKEVKPKPKPEPKPESKAEPAPVPEPKPAAVKENVSKPVEQEQKKGWLDKLKFWGDEEKTQPEVVPTPAEIATEPVKPASVKVEQPKVEPVRPRRPSLPEAKPKAPPQPAATLPPDDSPDFFEKMLEKIGF